MVPVVDLSRRHAARAPPTSRRSSECWARATCCSGPSSRPSSPSCALVLGQRHAVGVVVRRLGVAAGAERPRRGDGRRGDRPGLHRGADRRRGVCYRGAPVLVDVDAATAGIDPTRAAEAVTGRTGAIIPVHLYGRPDGLRHRGLGVPVVEDAAQAHGAIDRSPARRRLLLLPDEEPGRDRRRWRGGDRRRDARRRGTAAAGPRVTEQYVHVDVSQNFRMSEIEAAFIRLQLARLDVDNSRRRAIARHYRLAAPNLRWHEDHPDHVFHLCVLRAVERDRVRAELEAAGARPRCTIRWRSRSSPPIGRWRRGRALSPRPGRRRR